MFLSTAVSLVFLLFSIFAFSFVLWIRLRDDYSNDKIFLLTLGLLGAALVGQWSTTGRLAPGFSFWISLVLLVAAGAYLVKKLDIKLFEVVDAVVPSWFWFLFFGGLGQVLSTRDMQAFVEPAIALLAFLAYIFFQSSYRTFSWYPSGKLGFPGLASLGLYFFGRAAFGAYTALTGSLSSGIFNGIIGLVLFLVSVVIIWFRAKQ